MSGAARYLESALHDVFGARADTWGIWEEAAGMTRVLDALRRRLDHPADAEVSADKIARAVAAFAKTGSIAGFVQLKHVCLGAATLQADGSCLLADAALREKLLTLAETVPTARRQIKCFQCLLRSYWSFPIHADGVAAAARDGLALLRDWLAARYAVLADGGHRLPSWFATLAGHANLLGMHPCDRYGPALLRGDAAELQLAVDGLAIPGDSWVKEEAILAQVQAADALGDAEWLSLLPQLLDVVTGKAGIEVSAALSRRCVAALVARYARCASVDLHEALLDAAVAAVGNPWLRRATWEAYVLEANGEPCEHAHEMVNSWLKQRLIADFFRLHSADGSRHTRRAAYWQRFDPFIQALWVGINMQALEDPAVEQAVFRQRSKGCLLVFDEPGTDSNALILRIGDFLAVESGGRGRGLHLFRWSSLDPMLTRRLGSDRDKKFFSIAELMQNKPEASLLHQDNQQPGQEWERSFDAQIRPLVWQAVSGRLRPAPTR